VLDRVLRASRIVAFNLQFWNTKAHAIFNPATNMIRLHVPCSKSLYRVKPGMHFYLMVLSDAKFWESHPFTVASMSDRDDQVGAKSLGEDVPLLENEGALVLPHESRTMSFLIRPYDSSTSRLRDQAAATWPKPAVVRVMVDGPYGHTQPLHQYDNVTFVVGGSGIVVPLSYLKHLLANTSQTQNIHIHWAVRERAFAEDVLRQDFALALESERLTVDIYLGHNSDPLAEIAGAHGVSSYGHRMDVRSIVLAAGAAAGDSTSLAVVACGPANMADDARQVTGDMIRSGRTNVDYFEESFQW
jgi:predicted ferric reductase